MTESSFARLVFVASKSSSISRPSHAFDTEDPGADARPPAHRRRLAAPPFLSIANTRKKLFQLQIKIKVIFFFKKRLQQFVNFLKSGFIFTGITHWGQFYFVKCSQIKLFSNFYFVTKSS